MKTTPTTKSPMNAMPLVIIKKIPAPARAAPTPIFAAFRLWLSRSASIVRTPGSSSDQSKLAVA